MSENGHDRDVFDVIIVGAGPTGLYAAFYAGMREMRTKVVEVLPEAGGQLAVLYPEKYIYDVAGYPEVLAKDLVDNLLQQIAKWDPTMCLGERAEKLVREDDGTLVLTTDVASHYAKAVVICGGIGAFRPNKLKNESLTRFEERGVYYFVQDKSIFKDKRLLIVGGGDSAVDWALNLKDIASETTLIHRREGFRAHPSSVTELMESDVNVMLHYEVREVLGDDSITGVKIFDNRSDEDTILDIDIVLMNLGFKADLGPIKDWGLALNKRYIVVNGRMETNIPGVYAAGDVCMQDGSESLNLIAVGFGEAAIAVNHAYSFITGGRVFPGHSSEMSPTAAVASNQQAK
ncbi:MAG: NAD(P)/FAD-dependent oxidoreductase [Chloroflexi bacterium]|nr:NAD(P)/FAD-dependent oxidoreductase [Chloroflexota bacterium]